VNYRTLRTKLTALEAELAAIRAQGEILSHARIDSSKPGGATVRGTPSTQYRLRINGQKARYLKPFEIAKTRAAIARGKRLKQIGREMPRLQAQLKRIVQQAATLGLELPDS
jgi:hypothetical protein